MAKPATKSAQKAAKVTDPTRRRMMAAIRAACGRKGIDDDLRRDIQRQVTAKDSMTQMSIGELGKLLDHLNRDWLGPNPDRAHLGKVRALWWSLYWLGALHQPGEDAISAFVKRQTGIEHLRFLDHRKAHGVIEALKSWLEREGVLWWSDDEAAASGIDRTIADRLAVLARIDCMARTAGVADPIYRAREQQRMDLAPSVAALGARDLDLIISTIGKQLRRQVGLGVGDEA